MLRTARAKIRHVVDRGEHFFVTNISLAPTSGFVNVNEQNQPRWDGIFQSSEFIRSHAEKIHCTFNLNKKAKKPSCETEKKIRISTFKRVPVV
jgi:hypothetical protein